MKDYRGHSTLTDRSRGFIELSTVLVFVTGILIALIALVRQYSSLAQGVDVVDILRQSSLLVLGMNATSLAFLLLTTLDSECTMSTAIFGKMVDTGLWLGMYVFSMSRNTEQSNARISGIGNKLRF